MSRNQEYILWYSLAWARSLLVAEILPDLAYLVVQGSVERPDTSLPKLTLLEHLPRLCSTLGRKAVQAPTPEHLP